MECVCRIWKGHMDVLPWFASPFLLLVLLKAAEHGDPGLGSKSQHVDHLQLLFPLGHQRQAFYKAGRLVPRKFNNLLAWIYSQSNLLFLNDRKKEKVTLRVYVHPCFPGLISPCQSVACVDCQGLSLSLRELANRTCKQIKTRTLQATVTGVLIILLCVLFEDMVRASSTSLKL